MRLLVTGAAGMLGTDVVSAAERAGHEVVALARAELDVTDGAAVAAALADARPDSVVNCAAWTDVDGAEADEATATEVNGTAVGHLAAHAPHLVQVSTDYVFDGSSTRPYVESDRVGPISAYGRSKLAGEEALDLDRAVCLRAAWLFGAAGGNFAATMLRLAGERHEVTVVDDQVGIPTYTGHLAAALVGLAERRVTGMVHAHGPSHCSWWDFAQAIFAQAGRPMTVHRGTSATLDRPAPRPAYSVLGTERPGVLDALPDWREGLSAYLNEIEVTST